MKIGTVYSYRTSNAAASFTPMLKVAAWYCNLFRTIRDPQTVVKIRAAGIEAFSGTAKNKLTA